MFVYKMFFFTSIAGSCAHSIFLTHNPHRQLTDSIEVIGKQGHLSAFSLLSDRKLHPYLDDQLHAPQ